MDLQTTLWHTLSLVCQLCLSQLTSTELLLSQESSFYTQSLYATQEGSLFTNELCPITLTAFNFSARTAQKTLFLTVASFGPWQKTPFSGHCLAPGVYVTSFPPKTICLKQPTHVPTFLLFLGAVIVMSVISLTFLPCGLVVPVIWLQLLLLLPH
jgi:hypothetical protein